MVINGLNSAAYFDVVHASYFLRKTLFFYSSLKIFAVGILSKSHKVK
jgi:hypothetical protein